MRTKIKGQYRQGDVLIQEVDSFPPTAKRQKPGQIILALGEVTGHAHEIEEGEAWKEGNDVVGVLVEWSKPATHQEHGPIPLRAKRKHKIVRQREYSPEAIRRVAD